MVVQRLDENPWLGRVCTSLWERWLPSTFQWCVRSRIHINKCISGSLYVRLLDGISRIVCGRMAEIEITSIKISSSLFFAWIIKKNMQLFPFWCRSVLRHSGPFLAPPFTFSCFSSLLKVNVLLLLLLPCPDIFHLCLVLPHLCPIIPSLCTFRRAPLVSCQIIWNLCVCPHL